LFRRQPIKLLQDIRMAEKLSATSLQFFTSKFGIRYPVHIVIAIGDPWRIVIPAIFRGLIPLIENPSCACDPFGSLPPVGGNRKLAPALRQ
jgi:hypothetical protein